jgi:lipopolysaccharide export system permease protein
VLAPLLLTALVVGIGSFAFNERVVTRATATLKAWDANEYRKVPPDSGVKTNVFLTDGTNILSASTVSGTGAAIEMSGVTWYRRAPSGAIADQVRAARAVYANPGWRLDNATVFDIAGARSERLASMVVGQKITPEQVSLGSVDADSQSFWQLRRSINDFDAAGRRTAELKAKWWHKLSGPLSSVLMPLLGAVAAFGLARSGKVLVRAVIGMALGFAYFVVDNAALSMGSFGGYPPLLAAWSPFLLFAMIGETVLVRTEE